MAPHLLSALPARAWRNRSQGWIAQRFTLAQLCCLAEARLLVRAHHSLIKASLDLNPCSWKQPCSMQIHVASQLLEISGAHAAHRFMLGSEERESRIFVSITIP